MPQAKCESCGAKLPARARFCPECGSRTDAAAGETAVQELPANETGPVPVEPQVAQRRLFGVPPSTVLLVLGVGALVLAIALFATGRWPWGLILLGLAIFSLTGFSSQARRLPDETSEVGRVSLSVLGSVRARAGAAVETVAAHGSARIELAALRREVGRLVAERGERLRELGEAVYEGNRSATKQLKQEIEALDNVIAEKEKQMANVTMEAQERIERAQLQVQPTQILPGGEQVPGSVPEPATVPEPFPPPDEGQPPEPARIPEPFPPPDEGDRPQQPTIPEPGPE
ncbi:MAG TPA: zinc-ribbon domain-containing protein [Gaiellaceae bacterium]|nr:zinc-ribbon domain-containing protein [Gaiellaceae bacterium]